MISLEAFSELLEVLYSTPLDESGWPHFLARLSDLSDACISFFIAADSRRGLSISAQGGPFQEHKAIQDWIPTYNNQYVTRDPHRTPTLQQRRAGVFKSEDLIAAEEYLQSDLYRDLSGRAGLRYGTIMLLNATVRRLEVISVWRTTEQGIMPHESVRLLELLLPHIQLALEIRQAFGVLHQHSAATEAIADASPTPTLLLGRDGRLVHANEAANAMLQHGASLTLQNGCLVATSAGSRRALRHFLMDAAEPASAVSAMPLARALSLPRSHGRRPLQLLASPLSTQRREQSTADLLLLVTDPETVTVFPDDVLYSLYRLTPAEVEVANGLLMGYSLPELASVRRVSLSTVRNQLKSILAKTSTTRQSELMKLLMTLPQVPTHRSATA